MNCPVCTSPQIIIEFNETELDYCPQCMGVWLDAGELETLMDDREAAQKILASFHHAESPEKKVPCPRCGKKMEKVTTESNKKIVVDRCTSGHGLWFDNGEIQQIISEGSGEVQKPVVRQLQELFGFNNNIQ